MILHLACLTVKTSFRSLPPQPCLAADFKSSRIASCPRPCPLAAPQLREGFSKRHQACCIWADIMKKRWILWGIAPLAVLLLLVVVVSHHPTKSQKKSADDLAEAQGKIDSFTFLDDSRGMHQYIIRLSGYRTTFQIPSDFVKYFATARFQSQIKRGDQVSISIPTESAAKLVSNAQVPVFAIRSQTTTYLDEHNTLGAFNNRGNSKKTSLAVNWRAIAWAGSAVLLIGFAFVIWKLAGAVSARSPKSEGTLDSGALAESAQRLKKLLTKRERKPKLLTMGDLEKTKELPERTVGNEIASEWAAVEVPTSKSQAP